MEFIKKHYVLLIAALFIATMMVLGYFEIVIPAWAIWLFILIVISFATWRIVKTFVFEWHKAKKKKEKNQIVILGCAVALIGIGIFCGIHFSGLSQRLFPG
jgi:hypothetical protein